MHAHTHWNNFILWLIVVFYKLNKVNIFVKWDLLEKQFSWRYLFYKALALSVEMSVFPESKKFTHSVFHLHVLSTPRWELSTSNPASKGWSGELGRVIFKSKLPERNMEMRSSLWQECITRLTYHTLRDIQQIWQHVNTWAMSYLGIVNQM